MVKEIDNKRKGLKHLSKAILLFSTVLMVLGGSFVFTPSAVLADEWGYLFDDKTDMSYLGDINDTGENIMRDTVKIVRRIGMGIIVVALMITALSLIMNGNGQKLSENKKKIAVIIIAAVIFFSGALVLRFSKNIANALDKPTTTTTTTTSQSK